MYPGHQKDAQSSSDAVLPSYPLIEYLSFSLHHIITCIIGMNLRMSGLRKCRGCKDRFCTDRFYGAYNAMFEGGQDGTFMQDFMFFLRLMFTDVHVFDDDIPMMYTLVLAYIHSLEHTFEENFCCSL